MSINPDKSPEQEKEEWGLRVLKRIFAEKNVAAAYRPIRAKAKIEIEGKSLVQVVAESRERAPVLEWKYALAAKKQDSKGGDHKALQ
eukprot:9027561-Karenia_brevis.AAC.1